MLKKNLELPKEIKILLQGFPGISGRGYLGWSSVVLLDFDKKILFDTGNWGDREILIKRLKEEGLKLDDIDIIILSHFHFDHSINLPLFKKADIIFSKKEIEYADKNKEDIFIPEFIGDYLKSIRERLRPIESNTKLDEKITLIETPGHTLGSISCLIEYEDFSIMITGDAIKNGYEFISRIVDISVDREASKNSIKKIKKMADIIIPGHDRPFYFKNKELYYLNELEQEIMVRSCPYNKSWTTFKIIF